MFKLKFKTTLIAAVIASLLLAGFAVKSDAASVTSFSVYYGDDWGSGTTVSASLTTDEDIDFIDWHINGEYSFTSTHGDTQSVYEYLGTYVGDIKGKKYDVRAVVSFEESSDADASDTFRVYKPEVETEVHGGGGQQLPDVSGYVELTRHYFDGTNIIMEGYVSAYNGSDDDVQCSAWFRHTRMDVDGFEEQHDAPGDNVASGGTYGPHSADTMILNFNVGGPIGDQSYELNAHIHMVTGVDNRHVDSTNTFTDEDNP